MWKQICSEICVLEDLCKDNKDQELRRLDEELKKHYAHRVVRFYSKIIQKIEDMRVNELTKGSLYEDEVAKMQVFLSEELLEENSYKTLWNINKHYTFEKIDIMSLRHGFATEDSVQRWAAITLHVFQNLNSYQSLLNE